MLQQGPAQWKNLLKFYFREAYDEKLPDLVFYIDERDSVRMALIHENKNPQDLYGARHIWVLIFSDRRLGAGTSRAGAKAYGDTLYSLKVAYESLAYQREPGERALGGLLGSIFKALLSADALPEDRGEATKDTTKNVAMQFLGTYTTSEGTKGSFCAGMVKFPLAINTVNRIVVIPEPMLNVKFRSINYTFGNFAQSRFGASVGLGYRWKKGDQDTTSGMRFYLLGHIYLSLPKMPADGKSIGVVIGTRLAKDQLLKDLVLGLRGGLPDGRSGVIGGFSWVLVSDPTTKRDVRRRGWFVGLDFKL
jgi:hypothetical protein